MTPELAAIDHVHVFVSDRSSAERWYADVLGLDVVRSLEFWSAAGGPLTVANDAGTVCLALFEGPVEECRSTVAFRVDGAGFLAWRMHLDSVPGQEVRLEDHEVSWSLYFRDPDGNPYEITSHDHDEVSAGLPGDRA